MHILKRVPSFLHYLQLLFINSRDYKPSGEALGEVHAYGRPKDIVSKHSLQHFIYKAVLQNDKECGKITN